MSHTMKLCPKLRNAYVCVISIIVILVSVAECSGVQYEAINCRKHSAVLTDFGAVGDGKTSNTKAFKTAITNLSQYEKDGGALLVVPPGKWLTGSFNLTSHFTLFLQKGAVILATQNESEWPSLPVLPSYGRGRDAPGGRFSSLIFGTNLTDVVITECGALQYEAISCRKHSAVLTDFGAVGDGKTSNTKAFKSAITNLSQHAKDGGALLVVPPGKWLTGSFNLTSHFTLFLQKDAVILGSQVESEWPALSVLPSYGRGRDAPDGRFSSLIFGTNLTDVIITGICISNVLIKVSEENKKLQWNCTDIAGVTSNVIPQPCSLLPEKKGQDCPYPKDNVPIDNVISAFQDESGLLSAPSFCAPDSRCYKIVPQNSHVKVPDDANHILHRSDKPYLPPCHYKALPPSSRDSNNVLNCAISGSSECTNQEKTEQEMWRKDTFGQATEDKLHSNKNTDSKECEEVLLMASVTRNLNSLQSTSNAITKQLDASTKLNMIQEAVAGAALQPNILPEATKNCATECQPVQDLLTNESVNLWQKSVNYIDTSWHFLSVLDDGMHLMESEGYSNFDVGHPEGTSDVVESLNNSIPSSFLSQDGKHLQGVKHTTSINMKQNPSSPGFEIQQDFELNCSGCSLDGQPYSSSELCLPDGDSLIAFDEPFDKALSSPARNRIEPDAFSPISPDNMIVKLIESILKDDSPAPHPDDPKVNHGAGLKDFGHSLYAQQSQTQLCSNQFNSFQLNKIDQAGFSFFSYHSFPTLDSTSGYQQSSYEDFNNGT
ncbi:unnamed protein product [Lupinus luteus]|uniref:Rhamnogalacturonase A/B/Epimerase-like pectate lyase domain-containing protein n=1 Tax=Lupinus luteus TaxID=3873 RepID=A0AAV1X485_LUPLU